MGIYSIRDFYSTALEEKQGLGTAYEYFVKQKMFERVFKIIGIPQSIIVAGLPEKYGFSNDFSMLARRLSAGFSIGVNPFCPGIEDDVHFDLALSCEVLQSMPAETKQKYVVRLLWLARTIIIFAPNANNRAHKNHSHLKTVRLDELRQLIIGNKGEVVESGYIDMPPFPSGISAKGLNKSKSASSGIAKDIIIRLLGMWAEAEDKLDYLKPRYAHMVYCVARGK
jgi:hypothetical protein